ncbi:sulfotransferase family protein [Flammeovirga pacifica]|uniref:Sulfotransferase domain-containing protein n=1 Tax=Flammeovirga pacifica TaxID=915059 RepID=A0A1S1Z0T5_FLAPC|nr:sulfotransferase [Flammeovirga pacifica]OHX66879.1 hypothetical protein NH26_11185 [Flammeovirga pacifica]
MKTNHIDFLVVGAGKSGTTSIQKYLEQHPNIFLPPQKETLFWHQHTNPNRSQTHFLKEYIDTLEDYHKTFSQSTAKLNGEVCPSYLYYHSHVIQNLKKYHPNYKGVKIIIILREPVSKIISSYHFVSTSLGRIGRTIIDKDFRMALEKEQLRLLDPNCLPDLYYKDTTMYAEQVKAYLDHFDHVKVLFYDDLKENPKEVMDNITDFIGAERFKTYPDFSKKYNISYQRLVPKIPFLKRVFFDPRIIYRLPFIKKHLFEEEVIDDTIRGELKNQFHENVHQLEAYTQLPFTKRWGYSSN